MQQTFKVLHKTPNIGNFSPAFEEKWSHILHTASGELRDLIGKEFSSALGVVTRDITELESRITYGFGCSILDKFNDKVQEICDTLSFRCIHGNGISSINWLFRTVTIHLWGIWSLSMPKNTNQQSPR